MSRVHRVCAGCFVHDSTCQKLASASFQRTSMGQKRLQLAGGMLVLACGVDGFAPLAPTITTCARPTCMPRLPRPHKLFMGRPATETRTRRGSPRKEGSAKTQGIGAIVSGAMLLLAAPEGGRSTLGSRSAYPGAVTFVNLVLWLPRISLEHPCGITIAQGVHTTHRESIDGRGAPW